MKTWKKIEETKKRTGDIHGLKKRNEDKIQKVSATNPGPNSAIENLRYSTGQRAEAPHVSEQLLDLEATPGREKEGAGRTATPKEGGGQTSQNDQRAE